MTKTKQMRNLTKAFFLILALMLAAGLALSFAGPAGALAPPVQYYYVPFPEGQLLQGLQAIASGGSGSTPASPVTTYISIATTTD